MISSQIDVASKSCCCHVPIDAVLAAAAVLMTQQCSMSSQSSCIVHPQAKEHRCLSAVVCKASTARRKPYGWSARTSGGAGEIESDRHSQIYASSNHTVFPVHEVERFVELGYTIQQREHRSNTYGQATKVHHFRSTTWLLRPSCMHGRTVRAIAHKMTQLCIHSIRPAQPMSIQDTVAVSICKTCLSIEAVLCYPYTQLCYFARAMVLTLIFCYGNHI